MYVIEREIDGRTHFYAGYISAPSPKAFAECGVQWNVTKAIIKQLAEMGITDVQKKMILEKRKKEGK